MAAEEIELDDPRLSDVVFAPVIAKLREWNLRYEVDPEFPIENVRREEHAQVRQQMHIAPVLRVEEYAQQMRNGAMFPPILLMAPDVLIDGNTRLAAAKRVGRRTFPAIIVDTKTREMAQIVAGAANQMGGQRLEPEEAHEVALKMMQHGFPNTAIARELGRDPAQVGRWRTQRDVEAKAVGLGLAEQVKLIPKSALGALSAITHEEPFIQTAKLLAETRPSEKRARKIITEVQQAPSDQVALEKIASWRDDLAPAGPPPHAAARRELPLVRAAIATLLKLEGREEAGVNPAKKEEERERWSRLEQIVTNVLKLLADERDGNY